MGQEFHVVRCYSCLAFQSHQVRKDRKFVCKVCGAKQSVKKNYGQGTGKDCRVHVQKLNSLKGSLDIEQEKRIQSQNNEYNEDAKLPWETSNSGSDMFSATSSTDSQFNNEGYQDSYPNKRCSAGNASLASSCNPRSKWSSYVTAEADDSDEDTVEGPKPNASFRLSHALKDGLDAGFDHESPQVFQKKKWKQKTLCGPIRSRAYKTESMRQNAWSSGLFPRFSINIRGKRPAVDEMQIETPALKGGKSERLDSSENQCRSDEEQMLAMNKRDCISSKGGFRSLSESLLESRRNIGNKEEEVMVTSKHLHIRNAASCKIGHTVYCGNSNMNGYENPDHSNKTGRLPYNYNSVQPFEESLVHSSVDESKGISKKFRPSQRETLKTGSVSGCVSKKETSRDHQKGETKISEEYISVGEEQYPSHKRNGLHIRKSFAKNIPPIAEKMLMKEKPCAPSVNVVKPPVIKNPTCKSLGIGKHSSVNFFVKSLQVSSSILSQNFQGSSNSSSSKQINHAEATYSKYEAAEDLEDVINFDL